MLFVHRVLNHLLLLIVMQQPYHIVVIDNMRCLSKVVRCSVRNKGYLSPLLLRGVYKISDHTQNLRKKTSRQIDIQISEQRLKHIQNSYKSLKSRFGLKPPTVQQLQKAGEKYDKPKEINYDLQSLRNCSQEYPIYLFYQFKKNSSPFHSVIDKSLDRLWKAQKQQTLQILSFLLRWQYPNIDIIQMYTSTLKRLTQINSQDLFRILREFYLTPEQRESPYGKLVEQLPKDGLEHLVETIQLKILQKLNNNQVPEQEYGYLIKIFNLLSINKLLSEEFYYGVSTSISNNISSISPKDALSAYIFFVYNQQDTQTPFHLERDQLQNNKLEEESKDFGGVVSKLTQIIQRRIFADQCIKFYNSEQMVALLHTYIKSCILRGVDGNSSDENPEKQLYNNRIEKIVSRIQMIWVSEDFSLQSKKSILKVSKSLQLLKKQRVLALFHSLFLKNPHRTQSQLLTQIYLSSYELNMLTPDLQRNLQNRIVQQLFNLAKQDVSRAAWLFVVTGAHNMEGFYKKFEDIVFGGLSNKGYNIKEITVIVWALCSSRVIQQMKKEKKNKNRKFEEFWNNLQSFLEMQLRKQFENYSKGQLQGNQLINDCSWILWAYLNNQELSLKTIDLISDIIIQVSNKSPKPRTSLQFSAFQLTNITSFYYSLEYPQEFQPIIKYVKLICYEQFLMIHKSMQCAQVCRIVKYIAKDIWNNDEVSRNLLSNFELQCDDMNYTDVLSALGLLIDMDSKSKQRLGNKLVKVVVKLNQRRKRLISIEEQQQQS